MAGVRSSRDRREPARPHARWPGAPGIGRDAGLAVWLKASRDGQDRDARGERHCDSRPGVVPGSVSEAWPGRVA
jgi:hypothetical protein